MAFIGIDHHK